ncbi:MAG: aminotransferase class I/II-fold pyridoxal phosphate-dependent enzyme [Terrimicrobiaceae bacterium]
MDQSLEVFLAARLEEIDRRSLRRRIRALDGPQGIHVRRDGRELVNFSSNDYLGLANHPALRDATIAEWERGGFGAGASRLICGTLAAHEELEAAIAGFKRTPAALGFSSGYAAAMGTIPALCGSGDVLILDKLSHACLVDAAHLSGAAIRVFPHNDMEKLESHLRWARQKHPQGRVLVVAESVYSMDGDLAPLSEMVELKDRFGAWLFLDEAHAVGLLGGEGRGLVDQVGLGDRVEVQMGTLGKALGAHGAYIAGSAALREFLLNSARSFIFSTAPPAPVAAAAREALRICRSSEGEALRAALWKNLACLSGELGLAPTPSAIIPILIGDEAQAMDVSATLLEAGFLVPAIRYPTVGKGSARLRIAVTARHTLADIKNLTAALEEFSALGALRLQSR